MFLTEEALKLIEHQADKRKNIYLMFLVQILKELREIKSLLKVHQDTCNSGNNSSGGTDVREMKNRKYKKKKAASGRKQPISEQELDYLRKFAESSVMESLTKGLIKSDERC